MGMHNKSQIPNMVPVSSKDKLCIHLNAFNKKWNTSRGFFPEFFNAGDTNDPTPTVHENVERNMQDIDIGTKLTGNFNVETGLWDYQAAISSQAFKNDGYQISSEYRR